jgi:pimeloyl-ACP methyl ester carboxylesterase
MSMTKVLVLFCLISTTITVIAQPTTGYSDVNGIKMYYEIHGTGQPLVLIHGGGSTIQSNFATVLPMFAKTHKVIAVELQAHGRTSDRDAPESFTQDADDVATLLKNLHINKADILGFSNGGTTTMQIAIRHPELVNKLVIVSAIYQREGMFKGFFDAMDHATISEMPQHLKDAFLAVNNNKDALQTMFEKDRNRMREFKDWNNSDLEGIKAPSLIVIGSFDVVTREHAVKMSHLIPNSDLMILPGNHGSFIGEGEAGKSSSKIPALAVMAVNEFLEK